MSSIIGINNYMRAHIYHTQQTHKKQTEEEQRRLQELANMANIIGCNKAEFNAIIAKAVGKVWMSSGSWYTPYYIYDDRGLLAKYESNGRLIYSR